MVDTSSRQRPYGNDDIDRLESRGRSRQQRVAAKKAAGQRPASGESMDLADELDRLYDEGLAEGMRRGPKPRRPRPASSSTSSRPTPSSSSSSSSSSSGTAFTMPTVGASLDRNSGRTMILVFTAFSAVLAVARDTFQGTPPNAIAPATLASFGSSDAQLSTAGGAQLASSKKPAPPKEPVHLRAFAGVFVVGTIALALNEISPTFGVAMSGILLLEELLSIATPGSASHAPTGGGGSFRYSSSTRGSVIDSIGGALFNNSTTVTPPARGPQLATSPATPAQPPSGVHV